MDKKDLILKLTKIKENAGYLKMMMDSFANKYPWQNDTVKKSQESRLYFRRKEIYLSVLALAVELGIYTEEEALDIYCSATKGNEDKVVRIVNIIVKTCESVINLC